MNAIEIRKPPINYEHERDWANTIEARFALKDFLNLRRITPVDYPKALDVCSGTGALAGFLEELGWTDITYIDQCQPKPEEIHVKNAHWLYWDLAKLYKALHFSDIAIPQLVTQYKAAFDLVVCSAPYVDGLLMTVPFEIVLNYFKKEDGYIYHTWFA